MLGRRRGRPPHPDVLTPAEWRVLAELRTGAPNAEIAVRLGVSIATVKFHIRNIRSKLELQDRDDVAAWRPEPKPTREEGRKLLAPLGLLLGFWKPAAVAGAVVIVGGGALVAGVLAFVVVSAGESADGPGLPGSQQGPGDTTPTVSPSATPAATPAATPQATATPATTPSETEEEWDPPTIRFWGSVPAAEQDAIHARVDDMVEFFNERMGIRVPNLSIHVASDEEALEAALGRPLDRELVVNRAHYAEGSIYVHATKTLDWIERFYFEAFEDNMAGSRDLGPEWLGEGAAMYAAHLFRHWRGEKLLVDALSLVRWAASYDDTSLEALERRSPTGAELLGSETLSTATMAVEWLVGRAGEDALVAYYRALPTSESWEEAFAQTFGLSPQAAYRGYAAHRAAVTVVRRAISGRVLGPDGAPIYDPLLFVHAALTDGSGSEGVTASNGQFTVRPPDGAYRLSVAMVCPQSSGELRWYGGDNGFTTDESEATVVVVDGEGVSGIVIRLPALPSELLPECFEDSGA